MLDEAGAMLAAGRCLDSYIAGGIAAAAEADAKAIGEAGLRLSWGEDSEREAGGGGRRSRRSDAA
jgi:hypothetical protein